MGHAARPHAGILRQGRQQPGRTLRIHVAQGRRGLAALLRGTPEEDVDDATARTLGAAQMALFTGLMTQWLTDPGQASTASEVVAGLRALTGIVDAHA
ncbi:hypothetical protein ABZ953_28405 [Streptomyces sp. NPDC046465]|uniref:hypothetical protein n=1 Tax=Streptomyces sp. NPDC046465 TaxID=3155810 RepID=UPI0033C91024